MNNKILILPLLLIMLLSPFVAHAQTNTDKVRRFEQLMREWKSASYNTGSEKYTRLKAMVSEGCKMSDYVAKAYIEDFNASTIDIRANAWFQYIKENKISFSMRDFSEKTGDDGRRIVYCWVRYTQPGKQDREDFVGFKFDGGKIFYICNGDMTRGGGTFTITSCSVSNVDNNGNTLPFDAAHTQYLKPEIRYTCNSSGRYDLYVKFYDANGTLKTSSDSPSGYSYKSNISLSSGTGSVKVSGWGGTDSGHWGAGNYRFEFYYNGTLLYTYRFSVPEDASKSYEKGREYLMAEDYSNAIPYLRKAAEQGNAGAQVDLGWCYSTGNGVAKNKEEAIKWYKKSAAQGNATAQSNLGWTYRGVDDNEAVKWFKKAADQGYEGSPDIYNVLAYCAAEGRGMSKSFVQAHKYIDKAISITPSYWNYYDSKGEIYLMEGNTSKAREYYNKCVKMYSDYRSEKSELWKYFNK